MNAGPPPDIFVRRDVWALEEDDPFDPISLAYANAVRKMQGRAASDPTSWAYQAGIHGSYAKAPDGAPWNKCQHRGWFFLPWHRMFLYFFERIVRKAVMDDTGPADFALPYWNYDRGEPTNTLPPAFRRPTLPNGTHNPLYLASPLRDSDVMNGGTIPKTITSAAKALADPIFAGPPGTTSFGGGKVGPIHFGDALGDLESTPHNQIHGAVGGNGVAPCQEGLMSDPNCAALDPIFWLHHANIDRLWVDWASRPGHANPSDHKWLTHRFEFRDENGARVRLTAADILDTVTQLNYTYGDVPQMPEQEMAMAPTPPPVGPPELAAASEKPLVLTGSEGTVGLVVPDKTADLLSAESALSRRIYLNVEDITAAGNPGRNYAVYLESPEGSRHVGNVSLFGIEEMLASDREHAGGSGLRHTFDVTREVAELMSPGEASAKDLRVRLEPIVIGPPPGAEAVFGGSTKPHDPITIGRVSLSVA